MPGVQRAQCSCAHSMWRCWQCHQCRWRMALPAGHAVSVLGALGGFGVGLWVWLRKGTARLRVGLGLGYRLKGSHDDVKCGLCGLGFWDWAGQRFPIRALGIWPWVSGHHNHQSCRPGRSLCKLHRPRKAPRPVVAPLSCDCGAAASTGREESLEQTNQSLLRLLRQLLRHSCRSALLSSDLRHRRWSGHTISCSQALLTAAAEATGQRSLPPTLHTDCAVLPWRRCGRLAFGCPWPRASQ